MNMEIELNDEQAVKVETLRENGIEIGEAIDILFEMKEAVIDSSNVFIDARLKESNIKKSQLEEELRKVNERIEVLNKLKDSSVDAGKKQEIVEREYAKINDSKHEFKLTKAIFKF